MLPLVKVVKIKCVFFETEEYVFFLNIPYKICEHNSEKNEI